MQEICKKICKYIDCISQICQKIRSENMQKYAVLYATYADVHILHILHLYALPTLLMSAASRRRHSGPRTVDGNLSLPVIDSDGAVPPRTGACQ